MLIWLNELAIIAFEHVTVFTAADSLFFQKNKQVDAEMRPISLVMY